MHLIWENVVKNLMQLWTGEYKSLDTGTEDYELEKTVWEAIGEASASSGDTIPYIFGPRPPNVASDRVSWTADTRSFWTQYIAPVLLERRFKQRKYYDHFILFVRLIRKCLQFELSQDDITEIRDGFVSWVCKYERFYYQYDPQRLSACPLTIHALLHIADGIEKTGPVWTTWAFPMERYCGKLQPAIRSRRFPYASLNRYVVDQARLTQIKLMYGSKVRDELALTRARSENGMQIPGYDTCMLLPACRLRSPDRGTLDKILGALCTRFDTVTPTILRCALPKEIEEWGAVRIVNDGDTMRAAKMERASAEDTRDTTYVRYEVLIDRNARHRNRPVVFESKTLYGQLQHIYHIRLLPIPSHAIPSDTSVLLAAIQTCNIERSNHELDIHYFTRMGAIDYVDISTIQCVVGRIKDRGSTAIINRSGTLSRAIFLAPPETD
ncbi:hypothetical protein C2E23DRAFT_735077 [Lenzites betulinus]|nr:hypothetical protein C2E23DRAFT_735077 [Lenzites betulinus]